MRRYDSNIRSHGDDEILHSNGREHEDHNDGDDP